jgi:hypothetical protein
MNMIVDIIAGPEDRYIPEAIAVQLIRRALVELAQMPPEGIVEMWRASLQRESPHRPAGRQLELVKRK